MRGMKPMMSSSKDDWGTPKAFFEWVRRYLWIDFDLDVCASSYNYKVANYYDIHDNALTKPWDEEYVWCNPPYGKTIQQWTEKAMLEIKAPHQGNDTIVMLLPARTDTVWFQKLVKSKYCSDVFFIGGRLKFEDKNRQPRKDGSALFPSVLVVLQRDLNQFHTVTHYVKLDPKDRGF